MPHARHQHLHLLNHVGRSVFVEKDKKIDWTIEVILSKYDLREKGCSEATLYPLYTPASVQPSYGMALLGRPQELIPSLQTEKHVRFSWWSNISFCFSGSADCGWQCVEISMLLRLWFTVKFHCHFSQISWSHIMNSPHFSHAYTAMRCDAVWPFTWSRSVSHSQKWCLRDARDI